jgi:uncharacterized protein YqfA (UPF0365 family)
LASLRSDDEADGGAYVVGALLLIAGIVNSIVIPQQVWFSAVSFVIYVGGPLLGARLGHSAPRPALQPVAPQA